MKFASLFAGIGGFDLGLERAGMTCTVQVENDPYPTTVLERHWPHVTRHTDIKDVTANDLGTIDLLCGGFPCQDISHAGQRAGLAGERSGLWFEFARLIDHNRPEWVVIENVAGLLSSNNGDDLAVILGALETLGYEWAYRLVDSQWFGVAQRRRRVFIVGHRRAAGGRAAQVLLEPEGVRRDSPPSRETGQVTSALTQSSLGGGGVDDNNAQAGHLIPAVANTLTASMAKGVDSTLDRQTVIACLTKQDDPAPVADITPTLLTQEGSLSVLSVHTTQVPIHAEGVMHALSAKESGAVLAVHENSRAELNTSDVAYSLTASQGGKPGQAFPAAMQDARVRKLMPVECERLQGFPDGWADVLSDTRRYRALGNAVTVNVAEWLGRRIIKAAR